MCHQRERTISLKKLVLLKGYKNFVPGNIHWQMRMNADKPLQWWYLDHLPAFFCPLSSFTPVWRVRQTCFLPRGPEYLACQWDCSVVQEHLELRGGADTAAVGGCGALGGSLQMTVTAKWPLPRFVFIICLPSPSLSLSLDYLGRRPWLMCNLSLSSRIQKVDSMYAWTHFWPLEGNMLKDIFEKLDRVYTCTWKDMCERWEIHFWRTGLDIFLVMLS